ncbi:uncharacterized protein LOC123685453 [Harmonia axyridis]|uniref:uncharacterized protein LOC123685453 n=1 Tax=Harmonia axyridis TaxID=115357 RepID=UPI001E278AE3|nr:uncharacterized protein LOC123685453 [Harmonia axyridis]
MNKQKISIHSFLFVVYLHLVHCGIILDEVNSDINKVGEGIDCAFQGIGTFLGIEKENPCEKRTDQHLGQRENQQGSEQGGYNKNGLQQSTFDQVGNADLSGSNGYGPMPLKPTKTSEHNDKNRLDMRYASGSSSITETTTKKDGRRVISAHSNCEPGYVADSLGRCREQY